MARQNKYGSRQTPMQARIAKATGQSRGMAGMFSRTRRDAYNGFRRKSNGGMGG